MKVFISWSGLRSKHIATAFRDWLPNVLQSVRPFISSQDILKGARGNVQIAKELEDAAVGVICLTPENLTAPWILFEAGALSKLTSAYVCTYLYELEPSGIAPPLGQFQHTKSTKEETYALVQTINAELPEGMELDLDRLREAFDVWWEKLESQLKKVPRKPDDEVTLPERTDEDKLDELLQLVRKVAAIRGSSDGRMTGNEAARSLNPGAGRVQTHYVCRIYTSDASEKVQARLVNWLLKKPAFQNGRSSEDGSYMEVDVVGLTKTDAANGTHQVRQYLDKQGLSCQIIPVR
jgi:hypothetical protein